MPKQFAMAEKLIVAWQKLRPTHELNWLNRRSVAANLQSADLHEKA